MNKTRFIKLILAVFLKGENVMMTKFLSLLMTLSVLFLVAFSIMSCNLNNPQQECKTNNIEFNEKIVFQFWDGTDYELATINSDGTSFFQLTHNNVQDKYPSWFKDKSKIVFVSDRGGAGYEIFTMNPWGSQITQITSVEPEKVYPSTSWDDSKIVFTSFGPTDHEDIFIMDTDGNNKVNLTADLSSGDSSEYVASISPDNQKIVFMSNASWDSLDIYLMNIDGNNKINISNSPGTDEYIQISAWLNDGSRIVYNSNSGYDANDNHVYTMNPDGTNIIQLTSINYGQYDNIYPNWSYDGTTILFSSFRDGSSFHDNELYRMNIDGSDQTRITFISSEAGPANM